MDILAFIVLGGIAGWIASLIMGTDARQGIFLNVVVGCVGALIGGVLTNAFGAGGISGFNIYSLLVSIVGAIVLLWFVRLVWR